jgi:hypothetical protein
VNDLRICVGGRAVAFARPMICQAWGYTMEFKA